VAQSRRHTGVARHFFGLPLRANSRDGWPAALRRVGFNRSSHRLRRALTIMEEGTSSCTASGGRALPLFTSCCPAWIKFAEHYYPELLAEHLQLQVAAGADGVRHQELLCEEAGHRSRGRVRGVGDALQAKKFEALRPE